MSFRKYARSYVSGLVALSSLAAAAASCGGSAEPSGGPGSQDPASSTPGHYSIKLYVGEGKDRRLVELGPVPEVSGTEVSVPGTEASSDGSALRTMAITTPPSVEAPGDNAFSTAWALVWGAAVECGVTDPVIPAGKPVGLTTRNRFYVGKGPASCVENIQTQEQIVCIADKLAAVADAVGPIVWRHEKTAAAAQSKARVTYGEGDVPDAGASGTRGILGGPWTIPPQAERDRFIVRDLAIHALAHVPYLAASATSAFREGGERESQRVVCGDLFADILKTTGGRAPSWELALDAFGTETRNRPGDIVVDGLPSSSPIAKGVGTTTEWKADGWREAAATGLGYQAQILRASERLLYDLVRRSVYSDLSGAEQRRNEVMDPGRGNAIAWGREGAYNSYAHAFRVLAGRWELGPYQPDPACGGVPPLRQLNDALPTEVAARVADLPITTETQARAAQLVDQAGLLVPACRLESGDGTALRAALVAQLRRAAEVSAGQPAGAFATGLMAQVFERLVEGIPDADLRFALARARVTYGLLTNVGEVDAPQGCALKPITSPLAASTSIAPEVQTVGGLVVQGGLDRSRLATDVVARVGAGIVASSCSRAADLWSPWGAWEARATTQIPTPLPIPRVLFQDAFHVAQAMGRELQRIDGRLTGVQLPKAVQSPVVQARAALAETRAWAGTASMIVSAVTPAAANASTGTVDVVFSGVDLQEFSKLADSLAGRAAQFAAAHRWVVGPAWQAECVAGIRQDCAPTLAAPIAMQVVASGDAAASTSVNGIVDPFTVRATLPLAPTNRSPIYLVRLKDPLDPLGRGKVVATLPPVAATGPQSVGTSAIMSPLQRELLDMVFGVGRWVGERPPAVGDDSLAASPGYCVDGVPRDVFVPLENELTGDSDQYENSWRHYLGLAKQAAERADRLAEELILLDEKRDERREAAGEEVGAICGDFGAIKSAKLGANGVLTAAEQDQTLKACIGSDTYDVVFAALPRPLRESPSDPRTPKQPSEETDQFLLTKVLRCGGSNASRLCQKPPKQHLTFATLNLVPDVQITAPEKGSCETFAAAANAMRTGFSRFQYLQAMGQSSADPDALTIASRAMRMVVDDGGDFQLRYGDTPLMDSSTGSALWPGCMRKLPTGSYGKCWQTSNHPQEDKTAQQYNSLFRWCPGMAPNAVQTAVLGECGSSLGEEGLEVNAIRWRVQGAMWLLGAMTGEMLEGAITTPVPIAAKNSQLAERSVASFVPFDLVAGGTVDGVQAFRVDSTRSLEVRRFGNLFKALSPGAAWVFPSSLFGAEAPSYYQSAVRMDNPMLIPVGHFARASSPALSFLGPPGQAEDEKNPVPAASWLLNALDGWASAMDGGACALPVGDPGGLSATAYETLKRAVDGTAQVKAGFREGTRAYGPQLCAAMPRARYNAERDANCVHHTYEPGTVDWRSTDPYFPGSRVALEPVVHDLTVQAGYQTVPAAKLLSPQLRVPTVTNILPPSGGCGVYAQAIQAAGLACAARNLGTTTPLSKMPPEIRSASDIKALEEWLRVASVAANLQAQGLYLESVPRNLVDDPNVSGGSARGERAASLLKLAGGMTQLPARWQAVATNLSLIADSLEAARNDLALVDVRTQAELVQLGMQQLRAQRELALASTQGIFDIIGAVMSLPGAIVDPASVVGTFSNMALGFQKKSTELEILQKEVQTLDQLVGLKDKERKLETGRVILSLSMTTKEQWNQVQTALASMRSDVADISAGIVQFHTLGDRALYHVAKGAGAESVKMGDSDIDLPINRVLRRQADATDVRYRRALRDAKALAYMARRAIEQRIGMPLAAITTRVGPLDPPASWHDKVCDLTGVDYVRLRTRAENDVVPADRRDALADQAVAEFADAFIGDYVAKLENFVAYFNTAFPAHEGDDTTVLSLREDLLTPASLCTEPARNLLRYSGQLSLNTPTSTFASSSAWSVEPCNESSPTCLATLPGLALAEPRVGPGASPSTTGVRTAGEGVTWLVELPKDASTVPGTATDLPPNTVYQQVSLDEGEYVLSWWDQARTLEGELLTGTVAPTPYEALIVDAGSAVRLASATPTPHVAQGTNTWSPRREIRFAVRGRVLAKVGFRAAVERTAAASLALANVQLEKVSPGAGASDYVATGGTRSVVRAACPVSPSKMRDLFRRECDGSGRCSYVLTQRLGIDTESLRDGASPLVGKLARGNFNYRHVTLALNVVGTGVRTCTDGATSCEGASYVEYDLEHDASAARLLDPRGDARRHDFGVATIRAGKGIAGERRIGVPIGAADQGLLGQPGIEKQELRGRPLDGTYRLRIWERPDLRWDKIEDIQLVLKYRYWSTVDDTSAF